MMRRAARLDPDEAGWELLEECQHLRASERLADDGLARGVHAMDLKHMLGQVQADRCNVHGGWLRCSGLPDSSPPWHSDAVSGSHPPHLLSEDLDSSVIDRNER